VKTLRKFSAALLVISLGVLSAGAVTGCSDDEREQVELSVTERDLSPGRIEVADGEIEFVVKNDGNRRHAFAVETPDGIERTKDIEPGEGARLTVTLPDGRYRMYDPLGDYRARGVRGTVVVDSDGDEATVTERTVTEETVETERDEPGPAEPPVTVTEREVQPAPRPRPRPAPRPQPAPAPPETVTEQVPVEPPPSP
jgi:hypothetical protein